jgi:hypothetical protein
MGRIPYFWLKNHAFSEWAAGIQLLSADFMTGHKFDDLVKSRHSGGNRSPENF